jgi:hypothetical protein
MPLIDVDFDIATGLLPDDVADFLQEADLRGREFVASIPSALRGFVPSDYVTVYHALQTIAGKDLACGNSFCEWGSGLGVVASLAAMIGFDSYGIEIDRDLFDASLQLSEDFEIPVQFVNGSFVPQGAERLVDRAYAVSDGGLALEPHADHAYDELGLEVRDFDVIFAFPWPDDEELTAELFERFASRGALLLTYNDANFVRLCRKVR